MVPLGGVDALGRCSRLGLGSEHLNSDHRQVGEGTRESGDFDDGVVGGGEASGGIVDGEEGAGACGIGKGEGGSLVGGKGGGKADMAMAGGTDASGLPKALASVQDWVAQSLGR